MLLCAKAPVMMNVKGILAMKLLVIGSGGREHAIVRIVGVSGCGAVFVAPGNPGDDFGCRSGEYLYFQTFKEE